MRGKGGNTDGRSNRPRPQFNQHQNGDIGMKDTKISNMTYCTCIVYTYTCNFSRAKEPYFERFFFFIISVLRIRIRWILKILASWIGIRKNMRIHASGSKGQNINQKLQQKILLSKPKSELLKKER